MRNRLPRILTLIAAWGMCTHVYTSAQTTYNIYYGDIHSHSWYSDGNKEQDTNTYKQPVARAITYARDNANDMDFLGISDHNHHLSGDLHMNLGYWHAGNSEADSLNQDGVFVGMRGIEWGTTATGAGHVLIYGSDKLFGWESGNYEVYVQQANYAMLFDSVYRHGGFCYLAHPQSDDYDGIFTGAYNAQWDSAVSGVALKNGPALTQAYTESNPASGDYESRYHDLLKKGYHVAPCGNQDNHYTNFGMLNQQRTAVLATSLTRANILDALRNRRTYATEDHNMIVRFESGTHVMGDIFSMSGSVPLRVKVSDADGSNLISRIEIRYGIPGSGTAPTVLASATNVDSLVMIQPQPNNTTYYYYVYVIETNARKAWTAPMWVSTSGAAAPSAFSQSSPSNGAINQAVSGTLNWQTSANATGYDVYFDGSNPPTTLVASNQPGTSYSFSGLSNSATYYWKVVARNAIGTTDASGSPWSFTTIVALPGSFSQISPTSGSSGQSISGTLSWQSSPNTVQYDVYLDSNNPPLTLVSSNQSGTTYGYSGLAFSTPYYWKVVAKNVAGNVTATGAPWTFLTMLSNLPGVFQLQSPINNATGQMLSGTLTWDTSANATGYDVYLDQSNPPTTIVATDVNQTSYNYNTLQPGTLYYWKIVAKNGNGTSTASNAPRSFTTANFPATPSNLSSINVTTSSTQLTWTDNATNEDGYRVLRSTASGGPYAQVGTDLPAGTMSFSDTGLSIDTRFYYRIIPFNTVGEGNFASISTATRAQVPGMPVVSNVSYLTLTVVIDPALNPSSTQYAIAVVMDAIQKYLQSDGSLGATVAWRTYGDWGGASGTEVQGLQSCKSYTFSVKARNQDNVETGFGLENLQPTLCFSLASSVDAGWNLVSLPVIVSNPTKASVFPSSSSSAFAYTGTYVSSDTLKRGEGYWLKYDADGTVNLAGNPYFTDSIQVRKGWNIIGSVSSSVPVGSITEDPDSIITTAYYGYQGSYTMTDSIIPMRAYWVKSNAAGRIFLASPSNAPRTIMRKLVADEIQQLNSIEFVDNAGHHQKIYFGNAGQRSERFLFDLPPTPPGNSFDVRFASQRLAEMCSSGKDKPVEFPILTQGVQYPLTISWRLNNADGVSYKLGIGERNVEMDVDGRIVVSRGNARISLKAEAIAKMSLPQEFALRQNFPNPFNPSTEIPFDLPEASNVRLTVYNVLGMEVATLIDGQLEAGYHATRWQPVVASGLYFYRLDASTVDHPEYSFHQIRRMMLLK